MATRSFQLAEMLGKSKIELPDVLPTNVGDGIEVVTIAEGVTQFGSSKVGVTEFTLAKVGPSQPGVQTGIGAAWVVSGNVVPGGMTVAIYDHTAYLLGNTKQPDKDASWNLAGASLSSLPYATLAEAIDETVADRVISPLNLDGAMDNLLDEHTIDKGGTASVAGKSIKLDGTGRIDMSMMPTSLTASLQYEGAFTPTAGTEYPANTVKGYSYDIVVSAPFTWTGGALAGETANTGDSIRYDGTSWHLVGVGSMALAPYLKKDGSRPMTGNLDVGGHELIDVSNIIFTGTAVIGGATFEPVHLILEGPQTAGAIPTGMSRGEIKLNVTDGILYYSNGGNIHPIKAGAGAIASQLIDSLTSTAVDKGLTANQGKILKALIDAKTQVSGTNGTSADAARLDHDHTDMMHIPIWTSNGLVKFTKLPVGGTATQVAKGDHVHTGVYKPDFAEKTAFNKDFSTSGGENGASTDVARADHAHDNAYMPKVTPRTAYNQDYTPAGVGDNGGSLDVAHGDHTHDSVYEKLITKLSAFNKAFGTGADQVAKGDHNHDAVYYKKSSVTAGTGAPTGGAAGDIYFQI